MHELGALLMMGGQPGGNPLIGMLPIAAMLGIMYFLLVRPQQKEAKRHQEMLNALKKGDEVVTFGGLYGRIVGFSSDRVTLRIADNVKVEVDRAKILRLAQAEVGPKPDAAKEGKSATHAA
jgi:preprotein translocase subunit YajC